jgi:SAM-dependent methyltransferase
LNLAHRHLCASAFWTSTVKTRVLPWVLDGVDLGFDVLEVGPGYGAATEWLCSRAGHLTCVEIDPALARRLASRLAAPNLTVLCEDATRMSMGDSTCDGAVSLTMLHHLPSPALQDRLLAEIARVLRPGGVFVGFDALPGVGFRLLHVFDTMVVIDPSTFPRRLATAGFTDIIVDTRARGFRFRARRASHGHGCPVPQNGASCEYI